MINNNLENVNIYISEGKYLPWYVDSEGNADLKFDATEDEMYSY